MGHCASLNLFLIAGKHALLREGLGVGTVTKPVVCLPLPLPRGEFFGGCGWLDRDAGRYGVSVCIV